MLIGHAFISGLGAQSHQLGGETNHINLGEKKAPIQQQIKQVDTFGAIGMPVEDLFSRVWHVCLILLVSFIKLGQRKQSGEPQITMLGSVLDLLATSLLWDAKMRKFVW